jgi:hypothetical protein
VCRAVEDCKGQAIALTIENYFKTPSIAISYDRIKDEFPVGMVLAVREPYIHFGSWTGLPEILVTVPTDLEVMRENAGISWRCSTPVSCQRRSVLRSY